MKILIKIYNWIIKMAKKVLNLDTDTGAESWGSVDADNVVLDTTNFDKNLDTTITDVQKLADAVDDLELGGETVNIQTLTADKILTANDATIQILSSSLNRSITLPPPSNSINKKFLIKNNNADDSNKYLRIIINETAITDIYTKFQLECYSNGTSWSLNLSDSVNIGRDNICYTGSISIGNATTCSSYAIAIGYASKASSNSISIGNNSTSTTQGVSIGTGSVGKTYTVSLGTSSGSTGGHCICLGRFSGSNENIDNRLYIHSSTATVGANSLIYGEFDNRIVKINNTLYVNDLVGTGDRPIVADSAGKLKIGSAVTGGRNYKEFTSPEIAEGNSTSSVAYSNTQLGLDSINLNDKIKMVQCYVIKSGYQDVKNNILIKGHIMNNDNINIETNELLTGGDRIKIYIEYID